MHTYWLNMLINLLIIKIWSCVSIRKKKKYFFLKNVSSFLKKSVFLKNLSFFRKKYFLSHLFTARAVVNGFIVFAVFFTAQLSHCFRTLIGLQVHLCENKTIISTTLPTKGRSHESFCLLSPLRPIYANPKLPGRSVIVALIPISPASPAISLAD